MTPLQKAAFARLKKNRPNFAKEDKEGSKAEKKYDKKVGEKD